MVAAVSKTVLLLWYCILTCLVIPSTSSISVMGLTISLGVMMNVFICLSAIPGTTSLILWMWVVRPRNLMSSISGLTYPLSSESAMVPRRTASQFFAPSRSARDME